MSNYVYRLWLSNFTKIKKIRPKNLKKVNILIQVHGNCFYELLPFDFDAHFLFLFFRYLITLILSYVMSFVMIYLCLCWYLYFDFALLQLHSCSFPDFVSVGISCFTSFFFLWSNFDFLHVFFIYCLIFYTWHNSCSLFNDFFVEL